MLESLGESLGLCKGRDSIYRLDVVQMVTPYGAGYIWFWEPDFDNPEPVVTVRRQFPQLDILGMWLKDVTPKKESVWQRLRD